MSGQDCLSLKLHLYLDVHTGWEIQVHERVNSFVGGLNDVDKPLVNLDPEMFLGVLVGEG